MAEQKPIYPEPRVFRRLSQWAPDPSKEGERANLNWQMKGSNLELIVWSRGPNEAGKPPIRANLNTLQAMALVEMIKQVASGPGKNWRDLPVKNMRRANKEDPDSAKEMYDQAMVRVAKTSEGVVQIGVFDADETRPRILFPFTLDRWTGLIKINGEQMEQSEVSVMVANQYVRILSEVLTKEIELTTNTENAARYPSDFKGKQPQKKAYSKPAGAPEGGFEDMTY